MYKLDTLHGDVLCYVYAGYFVWRRSVLCISWILCVETFCVMYKLDTLC